MDRLTSSRNLTNKLWNAGKFILFNLEQLDDAAWSKIGQADFSHPGALEQLPLAERWIVSVLHQVSLQCDPYLCTRRLDVLFVYRRFEEG